MAALLAGAQVHLVEGDERGVKVGLAEELLMAGANPFTGWAPGVVVPVKRASRS